MAVDAHYAPVEPRRPAASQACHMLLLVGLGFVSHAIIHSYAERLSSSGRLHGVAPFAVTALGSADVRQAAAFGADAAGSVRPLSELGCSTGRLSVLVIHEHHLKPIGSDLRLLGVVLQLRSLGHTVSLLFRGKTAADQRSPPTSELATLLGAASSSESPLSTSSRPPQPPAIYEYSDLESLSLLARQGWFDAILCPLWFWRDPVASSAELLLPTLVLHPPPTRRPFLGILSDDAHSAKATMMAEWESTDERKALWQEKARTLPLRQRAVYALADAVIHISGADSALERGMFNASCAEWRVLRMSPRGLRSASGPAAASTTNADGERARQAAQTQARAAARSGALGGVRFGFVGNGITPTNHLSVQWFLQEVLALSRI